MNIEIREQYNLLNFYPFWSNHFKSYVLTEKNYPLNRLLLGKTSINNVKENILYLQKNNRTNK
jgi:hypothetical protein